MTALSQTPEPKVTYYGPCGRCEKHWTRKTGTRQPGVCRFCLEKLKIKLEQSSYFNRTHC
jgi:hypothetical protein